MGPAIYGLCALTAAACAVLLAQAYRRSGYRLLLWSALCFGGLTLDNLVLVLDKVAFPEIDLLFARTAISFVAMSVLLYGLIWDSE
jgi:hypothetical protein